MKTTLIGLVLVLMVLQLSGAIGENIKICLSNCIQCKKMYGMYFQGKLCGTDCITSNGLASPDCNNPGTMGNYLNRFF